MIDTEDYNPGLLPTLWRVTCAVCVIIVVLLDFILCVATCIGGFLYVCHLLIGWPI
jgi:hypothetical protein